MLNLTTLFNARDHFSNHAHDHVEESAGLTHQVKERNNRGVEDGLPDACGPCSEPLLTINDDQRSVTSRQNRVRNTCFCEVHLPCRNADRCTFNIQQ